MKRALITLLIVVGVLEIGSAQTVIWTGAAGNEFWDDEDNWNTGAVPTLSDEVRIENASDDVVIQTGYSTTILKLYCNGELTINDDGQLIVDGSDVNGIFGSGCLKVLGELEVLKATTGITINTLLIGTTGDVRILNSKSKGIIGNSITNNGYLFIGNTVDTGIDGIIINSGVLEINDALNGVEGNLINSGDADFTQIINVGIVDQFDNSGTISISGGAVNVFLYFDATNSGEINLSNASVRAINGPGVSYTLTNEADGEINISNTPKGILMDGADIINQGEINITNTVHGIDLVEGTLTVGAVGSVDISTTTGQAITVDATSDVSNSGSITLTSAALIDIFEISTGGAYVGLVGGIMSITNGADAIVCRGAFTNADTLIITGSQRAFTNGGISEVVLNNETTGVIRMNDIVTSSIIADVNNQGDFRIEDENSNVAMEGHLINSGKFVFIFLDNSALSGRLTNRVDFDVHTCNATALNLIEGGSYNSDIGDIFIYRANGVGVSLSGDDVLFNNSGIIQVEEKYFDSVLVTDNAGFYNIANGTVIGEWRKTAVRVLNGGTYHNQGLTSSINCSLTGVSLSEGDFVNTQGATLDVIYSYTGISAANNSIFVNNGNLTIEGTANDTGIKIVSDSYFSNTSTANIDISQTASVGIYTDADGFFNNVGSIVISSDFTGVTNNASFFNSGILSILDYSNLAISNNSILSDMSNSGSININKGNSLVDIKNVPGAMFSNTGNITISP